MMKDDKIYMEDIEGNLREYDYLFSFEHPDKQNIYVAFTPSDYSGNERDIYFGFYPKEGFAGDLYPVDTDEEKELLEKAIESFQEAVKEQ